VRSDIKGTGPDKRPDIAVSAKPFNRSKPPVNRSTAGKVERPVFDGRDLYRYHSEPIGFPSTEGQKHLIDKYVGWVGGDYQVVANAMEMTENPRRTGRLGELGDYVKAVAQSRGLWRREPVGTPFFRVRSDREPRRLRWRLAMPRLPRRCGMRDVCGRTGFDPIRPLTRG
jgi:hypothetical protein